MENDRHGSEHCSQSSGTRPGGTRRRGTRRGSAVRGASFAALGAALVLGASPATPAAAADWVEMGPAPITSGPYTGRTSAVVASPSDPDKYYVAGADGGVWRTTDGGQTWEPLMDDMPSVAIGALALDPDDEDILYAGTGEANYANHSIYGLGLYKSTDGGDFWTHLGEDTFGGRTFARLEVSPTNPQVLYAAIGHAGGFPARVAGKGHPGTDGPVGVFKSEDGGQTWSHLTDGLPAKAATDLVLDPTDGDVVYAAIGHIFGDPDNGIYRSKNGNKFERITDGLPNTTYGRISLGIAPSDPDRLYTMITRPSDANGGGASTLGIYRTDDGGGLWTPCAGASIQATYGWYLSTIIVAPDNPDTAFFGGLSMVRTTNAGQSFLTKTPPHVDLHGFAFDASGRLLSANDGGLHRSANLGDSWQAINDGLGVIQFYAGLSTHPIVRHFVLGGTQDNGTNRREEDGLRWSQRQGGDGGYTAINPLRPNFVWAEFQGTGNLFRSDNTGQNFSGRSSGINGGDRNCFLPPYAYDPQTPNRLLYCTHRVYESLNNGDSWTAISGDLTGGGSASIRALAIAPSDSRTVYAATNDGRVLVSKDSGRTWDLKLQDIPNWPRVTRDLAVDPLDHRVAYLGVGWYGVDQVYETQDRGDTWQPIDGDLPDIPVNTVAVRRDGDARYLYAGTDNGVWVSDNGGLNWTLLGEGLPNSPVFDLIVDGVHARLIAATQGRGAWYHPLDGVDCDQINKFKAKCKNGKLKGVVKSSLAEGTVLTFGNNDTDIQKIELNRKGKGKATWTGQTGQRTVCVGECQECKGASCN